MINITCANAITTVQQDSNLPKAYFNINGKFHTKETTFYVYLANDVYEIPLAKLQVNGSTQATMEDGINALATILVNAGSGGGGSLPTIEVDLSSGDFELTGSGVYYITSFGNSFIFNTTNISDNSRVIIVNSNINTNDNVHIAYQTITAFYQGTQYAVENIPAGMTYEFIYSLLQDRWYCLNPLPILNYSFDIGGGVDPYALPTIGNYKLNNTGGGAGISFPSANAFIGQEITVFNLDDTYYINIDSGNVKDLDGTTLGQIPLQTCLSAVSIDGQWLIKTYRSV